MPYHIHDAHDTTRHDSRAGGEGVATGGDDYTAIHKSARQKMPKGGYPLLGICGGLPR